MIFARVIRQFERAPGDVLLLPKEFCFSTARTMGTLLELATVSSPLAVVSITLHPRLTAPGIVAPSIEAFCEYEPGADLARALARLGSFNVAQRSKVDRRATSAYGRNAGTKPRL